MRAGADGDLSEGAATFHMTRGLRCVLDTNVALDLVVFRDPGAASLARAIKAADVLGSGRPEISRACMAFRGTLFDHQGQGLAQNAAGAGNDRRVCRPDSGRFRSLLELLRP
ncbi:MAG: hypothetical protein A3H32_16185 [Betaproteobacteria bacterium RIFCSPLOWO2_02_FULL_63_19]|nr:MAG: hypothetical protein A3H32_16185 [Betaproteobacteria bacterium RIFCSPLOWO2_02_FULL_63_19]